MSSFTKLGRNNERRDNTWVTTYPMGEDFIVASEGDTVFSFDPVTLEIKKKVSWVSEIPCGALNNEFSLPNCSSPDKALGVHGGEYSHSSRTL